MRARHKKREDAAEDGGTPTHVLRYEESLAIAECVYGDGMRLFVHPRAVCDERTPFFFSIHTAQICSFERRYSYWNSRNEPKPWSALSTPVGQPATCSLRARDRLSEEQRHQPKLKTTLVGAAADSPGAAGTALDTLNPMAFEDDAAAGKAGGVDVDHETTTAAAGSSDDEDANAKATAGGIGPTATFRCVSCADEMVRSVFTAVGASGCVAVCWRQV